MVGNATTESVQTETPPGETPPGETPPGETPPGETPPGETPPGETPPGEITYTDFEMKEGVELDADALALATPLFNKWGLDQAGAQEAVDIYSDLKQFDDKAQIDAFNKQVETWREDSKKDSEFGGDKFEENKKLAQSAVNKFGTPELKQLLEDYGVGNHPEIVRFMVKVGKLTAEDVPGNEAGVTGDKSDAVSILYPNARKS